MILSFDQNDKVLWNRFLHDFQSLLNKEELEEEVKYNPYVQYVFYEQNNQIVAFLNYSLIYDRIEINQIMVLEKFRHKGIASSLLEYLFSLAKELKIKNITQEVKKDNKKAIGLYHKFGFTEKAIRMGYYSGIDGILMEKEMIT